MESKYLSEMHAEHNNWLERIAFYDDELKSFIRHLEEVSIANSRLETRAHIEHFQNQFIRQAEVIDILKHDIKMLEEDLRTKVMTNPIATDRRRILDEPEMRDQVETFEKIFTELKEEYKKFLASTL